MSRSAEIWDCNSNNLTIHHYDLGSDHVVLAREIRELETIVELSMPVMNHSLKQYTKINIAIVETTF
jgi:hypothetical protein